MAERTYEDVVGMALDALGAFQAREKYGDAVLTVALNNLVTEGRTAPDINTDLQGAADHEAMVRANKDSLILGLLCLTDLLVQRRQREVSRSPAQTYAEIRQAVRRSPEG